MVYIHDFIENGLFTAAKMEKYRNKRDLSDPLQHYDQYIDPQSDYQVHRELLKAVGGYFTHTTIEEYTYCEISVGTGFTLSILLCLCEYIVVRKSKKKSSSTSVERGTRAAMDDMLFHNHRRYAVKKREIFHQTSTRSLPAARLARIGTWAPF